MCYSPIMNNIFKEYAELKRQIAGLEAKRKELELQVLDELSNYDNNYQTQWGKFSSYGRKVWEYSNVVKALTDQVAKRKKEEEIEGVATLKKVTDVLMFIPDKI